MIIIVSPLRSYSPPLNPRDPRRFPGPQWPGTSKLPVWELGGEEEWRGLTNKIIPAGGNYFISKWSR
jgi:hypothetical protein